MATPSAHPAEGTVHLHVWLLFLVSKEFIPNFLLHGHVMGGRPGYPQEGKPAPIVIAW